MANNSNRKAIEFMVQGALPPHSTNVLWMDTSVPTLPVLKIFENGAWTTVHTEDGKAIELLSQTVLAQQNEITELTEDISSKMALDATVAKDSTVAKQQTLTQGIQRISNAIANIDTSDLAKEATLQAVEQDASAAKVAAQALVPVAEAAEAYNTGKVQLAQNITSKGVQASASETLPELAEKVAQISQVVREIDGGGMYAQQLVGGADPATSLLWNLYEVLAQLKNQYLVSSGGNYQGILLGRFYKGYESIELSFADAYVTSDGAFYTAGATHIWADEKDAHADRWVAYLFASENSDFIIQTKSLCPRDIYIGGYIGSITFYTDGRLGSIVCGIEKTDRLGTLNIGSYTNPWGKDVVLRNINNFAVEVKFGTNAENIIQSGKNIRLADGVYLHLLSEGTSNVITFNAPDLETIYCANFTNVVGRLFEYNANIVSIRMPKLKSATTRGATLGLLFGAKPRLIDYEVGEMETNILLDLWDPTNVLASTSMTAQLVQNVKNHILAKISDRTGLSQLTCTFSTNMYNAIASTNIEWNGEIMSLADAFLTKNWLLAGA